MAKKILIASGKGGTGKTFFTSNLGAILAEKGKKVLLIDMDMGLRNLDLHLGLESKVVFNVLDVMTGVCSINQALIRDKRFKSLFLLPSSSFNDDREATPLHMKVLCDRLDQFFDYIIIDAPSGMGHGLEVAAVSTDLCVIVSEADVSAARDADSTKAFLKKMGNDSIYYILNKVHAGLMTKGFVPSIAAITNQIKLDLLGIIQFDENVFISTNCGEPIVLSEDTYVSENINKIANRIIKLVSE